jgi:hypothetical protein
MPKKSEMSNHLKQSYQLIAAIPFCLVVTALYQIGKITSRFGELTNLSRHNHREHRESAVKQEHTAYTGFTF